MADQAPVDATSSGQKSPILTLNVTITLTTAKLVTCLQYAMAACLHGILIFAPQWEHRLAAWFALATWYLMPLLLRLGHQLCVVTKQAVLAMRNLCCRLMRQVYTTLRTLVLVVCCTVEQLYQAIRRCVLLVPSRPVLRTSVLYRLCPEVFMRWGGHRLHEH